MSTLDGKTIASTFKDLLQVSNNNVGVDDTIRYIEDGEGTITALAISTNMVELSGDLVPAEDVTFDIGSATHRFKDLYLSGNTIYLGDTTFSTADIQAVKSVQDIGVENLPTFSEVATPAQGAKADSAIQPNDSRDLLPANNMAQDIGSAANHWMHVYTHHLSAHGDVIVGGEIHGPEILKIDPAAVGNNTGRVVIAGDLQVDGTTTTVNSTTMTVSGKTITLAEGATDATQVDGAGVEVAGSGANISYTSDNDSWNTNKPLIAPTLQSENTVTEQLNVTGNAAVDQMDLTAIEQVKNDLAEYIFIYDTSLDSDGGAWRHHTTHTSWYNEQLNTSTRGSRREFPAVAVIVTEADKVTIYDADDPDLPMWMVFETGDPTFPYPDQPDFWNSEDIVAHSIVRSYSETGEWKVVVGKMKNGVLYTGVNLNGMFMSDFVSDQCTRHHRLDTIALAHGGSIVSRNGGMIWNIITTDPDLLLHDPHINHLDVTVLPGAPINPDTGLPRATVVLSTLTGLTVIRDSGLTFLHEIYSRPYYHATFDQDNDIWLELSTKASENYPLADWLGCIQIPDRDYDYNVDSTAYMDTFVYQMMDKNYTGRPNIGEPFDITKLAALKSGVAIGTTQSGLVVTNKHFDRLATSPSGLFQGDSKAMQAKITTDHNTGWMCGDVKHAGMCDTTVETLGTTQPFDKSSQLLQNAAFLDEDGDNFADGWTYQHGASSTRTGDGTLQIKVSAVEDYAHIWQAVPTTPGHTYRFTTYFDHKGSDALVMIGKHGSTTSQNSLSGLYYRSTGFTSSRAVNIEFLAETDTAYIRLGPDSNVIGDAADFVRPLIYRVGPANHVVNGDFTVTDSSDPGYESINFAWEPINGATLEVIDDLYRGHNMIKVTPDGTQVNAGMRQLIRGLTPGARYELTYTVDNLASEASSFAQVQGTPNYTSKTHAVTLDNPRGTYRLQFVASAESQWLAFMTGNAAADKTCMWGNITIRETEELVVDGGFDQKARDWTLSRATSAWDDGRITITNTEADYGYITQTIQTIPGETYYYTLEYDRDSSTALDYRIDIKDSAGLNFNTGLLDVAKWHDSFVASDTQTQFLLRVGNNVVGESVTLDNFSVKLASPDHSLRGTDLVVHGNITKQPVAPGANLVSYTGFDEYNYMSIPHVATSDGWSVETTSMILDTIGTGDFYVMGWFKSGEWKPDGGLTGSYLLKKIDTAAGEVPGSGGWSLASSAAGDLRWQLYANGFVSGVGNRFDCIDFNRLETDQWIHVVASRESGMLKLYKNGTLVATGDATGVDVSNLNTAPVTIGNYHTSRNTEMSMVRIGADTITSDMVYRSYLDEKQLFQPGAQCTLYGDSDHVTAVATDQQLIHAGTSAGMSTISGLTRVKHETTPINNHIATGANFTIQQ